MSKREFLLLAVAIFAAGVVFGTLWSASLDRELRREIMVPLSSDVEYAHLEECVMDPVFEVCMRPTPPTPWQAVEVRF